MVNVMMFSNSAFNSPLVARPAVQPNGGYFVELSQIPCYSGIELRVSNAIQQRLGSSIVTVEQVSRDLCMSKRTLQRRLLESNSSFATIFDSIRFNVAVQSLFNGVRIDVLALHLGYSDRIAFSNAFKRWTNMSPSQFRILFANPT